MSREQRIRDFKRLLTERILVLDGAMGTTLQQFKLNHITVGHITDFVPQNGSIMCLAV